MKNPIQPIEPDEHGTIRFRANGIVRHLLDHTPHVDMNSLAAMDFSDDDRAQFAQLIGYSLNGFGELPYVSEETYSTASRMVDGVDEKDARIAALEAMLEEARVAIRSAACAVFVIHPDDLKGTP